MGRPGVPLKLITFLNHLPLGIEGDPFIMPGPGDPKSNIHRGYPICK
jgi:hypothetical protein